MAIDCLPLRGKLLLESFAVQLSALYRHSHLAISPCPPVAGFERRLSGVLGSHFFYSAVRSSGTRSRSPCPPGLPGRRLLLRLRLMDASILDRTLPPRPPRAPVSPDGTLGLPPPASSRLAVRSATECRCALGRSAKSGGNRRMPPPICRPFSSVVAISAARPTPCCFARPGLLGRELPGRRQITRRADPTSSRQASRCRHRVAGW